MSKRILVTGGAGFIGSALIRHIINDTDYVVINLDKLTYAGNLDSLNIFNDNPRYFFEKVDICDSKKVSELFNNYHPHVVIHLAAESHVDRSIDGPGEFIKTNIIGTYNLLEQSRKYWNALNLKDKTDFRFHHVSTDEVYGDLPDKDMLFTEKSPYAPSSPYSASKASSDHLVRAWQRTYGLPTIITNCSNNYGPYQFPEKLIPVTILNALEGKKLPIYGDGKQIRDWLYVDDHARALLKIAISGRDNETYNIGGHNEIENIDVVKTICRILDNTIPSNIDGIDKYEQLIEFVEDRAGHDIRYAIDASKVKNEFGWVPNETFYTGIKKTIEWYIENNISFDRLKDGKYSSEKLGVDIL